VKGDAYEGLLGKNTHVVGEDGRTSTEKDIIERDDFWAATSNKQLNFVPDIKTLLKPHGRKATSSPEQPDGRWRACGYDELVARDKASLDISWLKDESLADRDTPPRDFRGDRSVAMRAVARGPRRRMRIRFADSLLSCDA
jgi:hypothetical protein